MTMILNSDVWRRAARRAARTARTGAMCWAVAAAVAMTGTMPGAALAQGGGTALSMGAMKVSGDLPVEVTSDELQVDQTANTATFKGNVIVVQGDMRLSSNSVLVEYGPSEEGGRSRIQKMTATGDVIMTSPTESAEGREAVYTVADRTLVMTGDVVVTQGPSVVTGQRMVVYLDDGAAVMEGRVRTVIETGREAPAGQGAAQ
jgi:lipopolysaccharide export system protein LptA